MTAARFVLAALLVALAASSASAAGRDLLQSGVSCPNQIPACTARRCTTRILDSKETYVCLRCQKGYFPVKGSDGKSVVQCVCPQGTYQYTNTTGGKSVTSCVSCPAGSYCPGGNPKARKPTDNIGGDKNDCNPAGSQGLTTKSEKTFRPSDCIAQAGYVLPSSVGGQAQICQGSTYAPDNNRLKTCLPCQSGLELPANWNNTTPHADKMEVCQVPPGKFWELNVVRDCPKGLYREDYVRTDDKAGIACLSCPEGWTTANIGTDLLRKCNVLLPGYKLVTVDAGNTTSGIDTGSEDFTPSATEPCPIGYYNDGSSFGCIKCPYSATTLKNGSTSADDCMVPPGYYASSATNTLALCPTTPANDTTTAGYYRSGWKNYKEVVDTDGKTKCTPCGEGILSTPMDADEMPGAAAGDKVPATTSSCYILGGWGITFNPEDYTQFKAIRPCPANTYGVAGVTYGLINAPCKACTKNLYSPEASNSFDDCKNPGGFGYTSEGANQCPDGFWAAKDSMAPCEQCPPGRTTLYQPGNGTLQDSIDDCYIIEGNGVFSGNSTDPWNVTDPTPSTPAQPCPIGMFSSKDTLASSSTCQPCPGHTTTTAPGSTSCNACAAGYGKPNTTSSCAACMYGSFSYGTGDSCSTCPSTTFNDFVGDGYTSYGITVRTGMKGDESCVPRYAQLPKPVGDRMGLPDDMFVNVTATGADTKAMVKSCVEACPADQCCIAQMEKPDNGDFSCKHARLAPVAASAAVTKMFYKLPPSTFAAASLEEDANTLQAKTIASGIYAICDISAYNQAAADGLIGTSNDPTKVEAGRDYIDWDQCTTLQGCKAACDKDATCWGFIQVADKFALRGGESWLGGRTFFASPDGNQGFDLNSLQW